MTTSSSHLFKARLLPALLLILLSAASLATVTPRTHAQQSSIPSSYKGPSPSGVFEAINDFTANAPGVGTIPQTVCTDGTTLGGANILINCDSTVFPHNEMSVAVDPADPNHLVAGSNDYELFFQGSTVIERIIAGYYTSFDHGATWINGHINPDGFTFNGDPAVAFNMRLGLVHYITINFNGGQGGGFSTASILASTSSDGGKTFGFPKVVALGTGGTRVTTFNDKPYAIVDNNPTSSHNGRLYVTWTQFLFGQLGNYLASAIFLSFSDDGGNTFSTPTEISGRSSTLCAHPFVTANGGICNEDQFSSPVVGPDGTLYVAFQNDEFQGGPEFRDQFLVVTSTDGGQTFQGPFQAVGPIFDGTDDYPVNINGRQTLSNSQFRVNTAGNLAVDPTSGAASSSTRLYYTFSDNRNGGLTGSFMTVTTNTDVFVVTSADGGRSWSSVIPVLTGKQANNDQFYPWAAVDGKGKLLVAFSDRSYDPANIQYGETLAESDNHAQSFRATRVDSGLSNPNDSRWFTNGGLTNGKATFIGDYNGLAIGSDGLAHAVWTDMRPSLCAPATFCWPNPPLGRGHNSEGAVTVDPGVFGISTTMSFDGVTVTTTASFSVNVTTQTVVGTSSVKVVNNTSGATILSKNFTISIVFGTSLNLKLVLAVPVVPLTLSLDCFVAVTGTTGCVVSRDPDVDHNGFVDIADAAIIGAAWQSTPTSPSWNPAADLLALGTVNISGVSLFGAFWQAKVFQ